MARMIGKERLHNGAVVSCCSNSGCNWNSTTAVQNIPFSRFRTGGSQELVSLAETSLLWIVLVLLLLVLALLILLLFYRSKLKLQEKQGTLRSG